MAATARGPRRQVVEPADRRGGKGPSRRKKPAADFTAEGSPQENGREDASPVVKGRAVAVMQDLAAQERAAQAQEAAYEAVVDARDLERQRLVANRAERRRLPWRWGAGAALLSAANWGLSELCDWLFEATPSAIHWALPALPLLAAVRGAVEVRDDLARWWMSIAGGGVSAAGVVWWVGVDGPTWPAGLVLFGATLLSGWSLWKAHPVGPTVELLMPEPEPEPAVEPEAEAVVEEPQPELDVYAVDWKAYVAGGSAAPGSVLSERVVEEYTTEYMVTLDRRKMNYQKLQANVMDVAAGLGIARRRLLIQPPPADQGAHRAKVVIITKDPVAKTRFYTGPKVVDGTIVGLYRYIDGKGEGGVSIWRDNGMVPTMIVGGTGGGKSGAANVVTVGVRSTGVMNDCYVDPKGNSSTAYAARARIALIGEGAALRAPELIQAIIEERAAYAQSIGSDLLRATAEFPGWYVLHDEFSLVVDDTKVREQWRKIANIVRSLGIWLVALNQALQEGKWGDEQTRSAFASQVIAFAILSKSSDDLIAGMEYRPNSLPVDENGIPVPGMGVTVRGPDRNNVPGQWDFLPSKADAAKMTTPPPYTTETAFDTFSALPDVHPIDVRAIERILGPAVNGRWHVGPGGTHAFPGDPGAYVKVGGASGGKGASSGGSSGGTAGTGAGGSGVLAPVRRLVELKKKADALTGAKAVVFELLCQGVTGVPELEKRSGKVRSTVNAALDQLMADELAVKEGRGQYFPAPEFARSSPAEAAESSSAERPTNTDDREDEPVSSSN